MGEWSAVLIATERFNQMFIRLSDRVITDKNSFDEMVGAEARSEDVSGRLETRDGIC